MKNKDKYRERIIEIAMNGDTIAVTKDGMVGSCYKTKCGNCIFTTEKTCRSGRKKWMEQEAEILDETEKTYLRSVIKPFIARVLYIRKNELASNDLKPKAQFIAIVYNEIKYLVPESYDQGEILLPSFAIGTMYKGMEVGHKYTVEELGL